MLASLLALTLMFGALPCNVYAAHYSWGDIYFDNTGDQKVWKAGSAGSSAVALAQGDTFANQNYTFNDNGEILFLDAVTLAGGTTSIKGTVVKIDGKKLYLCSAHQGNIGTLCDKCKPDETHAHGSWEYSLTSENKLTAECKATGSCYLPDHKVSLELYFSDSAATIMVGNENEQLAWSGAGLTVPTNISYEKSDGTPLLDAPTTVGNYVAKVSPVGVSPSASNTAKLSFSIHGGEDTSKYAYDDNNHWHPCKKTDCTLINHRYHITAHSYDNDTHKCVCGKVKPVSHQHTYGAWSKNGTHHWHECTDANCPDKAGSKEDEATHRWGDWNSSTGTRSCTANCGATDTCNHNGAKTGICSICKKNLRGGGYTPTPTPSPDPTPTPTPDPTPTPSPKPTPDSDVDAKKTYPMLSDGTSTVFIAGQAMTFRSEGAFKDFANKVDINGVTLTLGTDYTAKEGSTIISLLPAFTSKMKVGDYTLTMYFKDGYTTSKTFKVKETQATNSSQTKIHSPKTGESSTPYSWMVLLVASVFALTVLIRKRES